jgi:uncharacterized protein YijF (DUF1287 family)
MNIADLMGQSPLPVWTARRRTRLTILALLFASLPETVSAGSAQDRTDQLIAAALAQVGVTLYYDPAYTSIPYPNGDVPIERGVCTDVIVRAYRKIGIDLQVEVHNDMKANFRLYPKLWGLSHPDPNIDHRRVPNLAAFFSRKGQTLPITNDPSDYLPGRQSNKFHSWSRSKSGNWRSRARTDADSSVFARSSSGMT